jgi:L-amino acid N-acyltransferase YncA
MPQYNIRRYTKDDLPFLMQMHWDFTAQMGKVPNDDVFKAYVEKINEHGLIIVIEDDKVVGLAAAVESQNHHTGAKVLYRTDIFVDPTLRGQGIASLLNNKLKEIGNALGFQEYSWELHGVIS